MKTVEGLAAKQFEKFPNNDLIPVWVAEEKCIIAIREALHAYEDGEMTKA